MGKIVSMTSYCLDTHAIVWYFTGQTTLSRRAKEGIDDVFSGRVHGYISIIVLLELLHLSFKHSLFSFPVILRKLRQKNVFIVPVDKPLLTICYRLPVTLEIHDRIIAATAKRTRSVLVTKDAAFTRVSGLSILW